MKIDKEGIYCNAEKHLVRAHGGPINPRFIVMHYTAGWSAEAALSTFSGTNARVSAHFVIARDGKVYQCVPCNEAAWHAGPSAYHGVRGLNQYSIGIEFVNIGWLKPVRDKADTVLDPYGKLRKIPGLPGEHSVTQTFVHAPHPRVGGGTLFWATYTDEQLDAADILVTGLIDRYNIEDIVSHEQIDTRGWKTDPGPAFPMDRYRLFLNAGEIDRRPRYTVRANPSLNVRGGPGTGFEVIANLSTDDKVWLLERDGDWCLVRMAGEIDQGWVHGNYIVPA